MCGGHLTPALAVIDELKRLAPTLSIYFVGRTRALEAAVTAPIEYVLAKERGIQFLPITTGRLPRYLSIVSFLSLFKLPIGFIQAWRYITREKPRLILSFGGYVSLPVCIVGKLLGVPVFIHEQALIPGLTNSIVSTFATKIFVSFKEQVALFPSSKTVYTGLPIRRILFHPPKAPTFSYEKNLPLLYITGGATGAVTLNNLLFPIISDLVKTCMVIHQTGEVSLGEAKNLSESLPGNVKKRYVAVPTLGEADVSWVYHHATLVIGRSGANTVGELAALGKIAVLIPLPWSAGHEQQKNAEYLARHTGAVVADQTNITPDELRDKIFEMMRDKKTYEKRSRDLATHTPHNAAATIVRELIASAQSS